MNVLSPADYLGLLLQFALLSCLSVGGALAAAPEMHRYLVDQQQWLSHQQFNDAISIAQAAPGPNILFVTLLGWQVAGLPGAFAATVGIIVPSSLITFYGYRLKVAYEQSRLVRAIRRGLMPIAIGLTASTGWVIASAHPDNWRLGLLTAVSVVVYLRARFNPLWLIVAGALAGMLGIV